MKDLILKWSCPSQQTKVILIMIALTGTIIVQSVQNRYIFDLKKSNMRLNQQVEDLSLHLSRISDIIIEKSKWDKKVAEEIRKLKEERQ